MLVLFGVSAFVRLYKAKSLPEGTDAHPAALGFASAKQLPSTTRSDVVAEDSPLSIKPIIMASDNTEDILYTDYTIRWQNGTPCVYGGNPATMASILHCIDQFLDANPRYKMLVKNGATTTVPRP